MPTILVSWGELFDKISILEIKQKAITEEPAHGNILRQLSLLREASEATLLTDDAKRVIARLKAVNQDLWNIENGIRRKEAQGCFDGEFIELARSVYRTNDLRFRLKKRLDEILNSPIVEEKSYL